VPACQLEALSDRQDHGTVKSGWRVRPLSGRYLGAARCTTSAARVLGLTLDSLTHVSDFHVVYFCT